MGKQNKRKDMDWPEIVIKSKMGVVQLQLLRKKFYSMDHLDDYVMTNFRRECLSLVFSRLDRLRVLERYKELEGVEIPTEERLEPPESLFRRYKGLSDHDLIMTAIYYPSEGFDRLMYNS
jgi:hypothetical protein